MDTQEILMSILELGGNFGFLGGEAALPPLPPEFAEPNLSLLHVRLDLISGSLVRSDLIS
jgi:hypothetical protein